MTIRRVALSGILALACAVPAAGQTTPAPQPPASADASNGRVGIAVSASTLGVSLDAAVRVARKANLRAGVNLLDYSREFDIDGTAFATTLTMRSVHVYLDWFPGGGGFHISPGMVLHNGNRAAMTAAITPGQGVVIDDEEYQSSASNPIRASGEVLFKSTRPALLIGWGNMIPRSRRVSVPFQLGVVFQGEPAATLAYSGTACAPNGTNCRDMAGDATIQSHIRAQEAQLNDDIRIFRFYPVLSLGIGIRF